MSEANLINQARQGREPAWLKLVEQHQQAVFRLAYLLLADTDEAHDIAQDTFIRAFHALHAHLIEETTVRNQPAVWVEGPYPLQLTNGSYELRRVIEGHTLIWTEGDITYRLESSRPLTETRQIAESLE